MPGYSIILKLHKECDTLKNDNAENVWKIDAIDFVRSKNGKFPIGHQIGIDIIELCRSNDYNGRSRTHSQREKLNGPSNQSIDLSFVDAQAKMQSQHIFAFVILLKTVFFRQSKRFSPFLFTISKFCILMPCYGERFHFALWNLSFCWQCQAVNSLGMQSDTNLPFAVNILDLRNSSKTSIPTIVHNSKMTLEFEIIISRWESSALETKLVYKSSVEHTSAHTDAREIHPICI